MFETIKHTTIKLIISQILKRLPNMSEKNILHLLELGRKLDINKYHDKIINRIREAVINRGPALGLIKKLSKLNPNCRNKLIQNLMINAALRGEEKRISYEKKYGTRPPWFFVISPTMRCNLRCIGCYAGNYTKQDDLPYGIIDRVLTEAKEFGIHFITISGGEPFIRKDLLKIFEKHNDIFFLVYTNGTLIDRRLAKKLAKLGNVAPGISVEGFEKETDLRRGKGIFKKVMQAMRNLKREGVPFGFSATPTRLNSEIIISDEFIDFYIKKDCLFGWLFQYIPIGRNPDVNLMATPEQRNKLRETVHKKWRKTKAIFIGDFWNDGPYVKGCIAGARPAGYFHIMCTGDVEPCVFVHFAVDNIKNKSLIEVINSDFFKAIREKQKTIKNWLTPCCIIDNPTILKEVCEKCNARPTHDGAETIIKEKKIIKHLNKYSKKFKEITQPIWEKEYKEKFLVKR